MRPIKLVMNAFGPYKDKVELDFTKFGSSQIFLVSGATGSGKTTIFDGITYALYNNASGDMRDSDMLKSQFATDEDECYVELTFEINSMRYRIKRNPKQMGPGKRQKTINLAADVEFYKEDQLVAQGNQNANKMIEELLGLSYQQFKQIVLLPQGEFRELLLSSSKEKEEIFRNIFETEDIQRFQEHLQKERRELEKSYNTYGTKLEQSIANIDEETLSENPNLLSAITHTDYEMILKILKQILESDHVKVNNYRNNIKKLDKKIQLKEKFLDLLAEVGKLKKEQKKLNSLEPEIKGLKQKLETNKYAEEVQREYILLKNYLKENDQLSQKITKNKEFEKTNQEELKDLKIKEKESKQEVQKLDNIRSKIQVLIEEIKTHDLIIQQEKEITKKETTKKNLENEIEKLNIQLKKNQTEISENSGNLENVDIWRETLEKTETIFQEKNEFYRKTENKIETLEKTIEIQKNLSKLITRSEKASQNDRKAKEEYENKRKIYFGNLAGILVEELIEDEPCPVCGSTEHPNPVIKDSDSISEEELNRYEEVKNKKHRIYAEIDMEIQHCGKELKDFQSQLHDKYQLSFDEKDYSEILLNEKKQLINLKKELNELEEKRKQLNHSLKQEKTWRDNLEAIKVHEQKNTLQKTEDSIKLSNTNKEIERLEKDIEKMHVNLSCQSKEEAKEEKEQCQKQIKTIEKTAEKINSELNQKRNEEVQIQTSIQNTKEQLEENKEKEKKQKLKYEKMLVMYKMDENFQELLIDRKNKTEYEKKIDKYNHDLTYNTRQLLATEDKIQEYKTLQKQSKDQVAQSLEMYQEQKNIVKIKEQSLNDKLVINQNTFSNIKVNYTESKQISEPLAIYSELAEIANGSTKRTNYVSFERYVLSIYFHKILDFANERFQKMTNNRYQLVHREDGTKGRGADGLEINIFDQYSGQQRSVKSLSGGETFKASLALALGLSDVIQNQQGGIHVDTLFIDEGFGTLDDDSLEIAIETLMDLQTTGRLIGIISHVGELKDRIPTRILVENQKEGSSARIEVN